MYLLIVSPNFSDLVDHNMLVNPLNQLDAYRGIRLSGLGICTYLWNFMPKQEGESLSTCVVLLLSSSHES